MKKLTNLMLIASLVVAAVTVGCNRDTNPDNGKNNEQGERTGVSISLCFDDGTTRAPMTRADSNGTTAESDVKSVDVYIYTSGGAFLSRTTLTPSDFNVGTGGVNTPDQYTTKTPIPTTTGDKSFYVGINLPTAIASSLEGETLASAGTIVQTIAKTDINLTNGLPMFSVAAVSATMAAPPATNSVTVNAQRIVAKVTVEKASDMVVEGTPGVLGDLTWAINNQNLRYYLLQGAATNYADPNWTAASYTAAQFAEAVAADYVAVNQGPVSDVSTYNAQYAVENTSEAKTTKELTRVTIKATFTPNKWVTSYTSGSKTTTAVDNPNATANPVTPTDFYTVTPSVGANTVYFQNQADAQSYAADMSATVATFTGGVCYWNVFLNKAGKGDVLRNDFYKCNIKRIVAPGQSSDALTKPDAQPEEDSSVSVTVVPENWHTPVMDDQTLQP